MTRIIITATILSASDSDSSVTHASQHRDQQKSGPRATRSSDQSSVPWCISNTGFYPPQQGGRV
eukprot:3751687-Rhodomonas_salina.2